MSLIFEKTNNGIMVFKCSECGSLVFNDNDHLCTAPSDNNTKMKGVRMGIQQTNGDETINVKNPSSILVDDFLEIFFKGIRVAKSEGNIEMQLEIERGLFYGLLAMVAAGTPNSKYMAERVLDFLKEIK